jgi:hypothetical protein
MLITKSARARRVHGYDAPPARPTVLGAAVVAGAITFPIGVMIFVVDLLFW